MSALLVAARYLTTLPLPGATRGNLHDLGAAAAWFPVVGLALGVVLVAVERATVWLFPPLLAALLVVTAWKLLTGGLHLDGLADCLDGLVGRDAAHRLAIMRDSRIGTFGAIGLILFLFLEIAALAELPHDVRWRAVLVAPAIGRATPPLLGRLFRQARSDGHGAAFCTGLGRFSAPVALLVAVASAAVVLGWLGVVTVAVALIVTLGVARAISRGLGGITGDVLGAGVEAAELTALLTVSAWLHARP